MYINPFYIRAGILSLGRYEDLLDIERVDIVKIHQEEEVDLKRDMYIPVAMAETLGIENSRMTVYHLTKEYEIIKQGLRRWKKENGRGQCFLLSCRKYTGAGCLRGRFRGRCSVSVLLKKVRKAWE